MPGCENINFPVLKVFRKDKLWGNFSTHFTCSNSIINSYRYFDGFFLLMILWDIPRINRYFSQGILKRSSMSSKRDKAIFSIWCLPSWESSFSPLRIAQNWTGPKLERGTKWLWPPVHCSWAFKVRSNRREYEWRFGQTGCKPPSRTSFEPVRSDSREILPCFLFINNQLLMRIAWRHTHNITITTLMNLGTPIKTKKGPMKHIKQNSIFETYALKFSLCTYKSSFSNLLFWSKKALILNKNSNSPISNKTIITMK